MKKIIVLFLCAAMLWPSPISFAGPQGGKVVGGNAQIKQNGASTTINQTTDRAIINWKSFDINKNESVRHNMPSSNSAGLHRVVGGGGASQIAGSLQSNGNIYLVNPAGVVIHKGAKIDVNSFVATSRDISDQNFMKGNMVFDRPGKPDAKIINKGNITLKDNGLAALVAPTVRNDGVIAGKLGKVALGGSDAAWKLDMTGDDLIAFTLDEKAVNTLHSADGTPLASVENNGKIKAEGGVVVMSAAQLDGFVGSVVNNGEISAASVENRGGKIIFRGQGDKVDLVNNSRLDVSSKNGDGGMVRMSGQARVVNAGNIDTAGAKGGKVVLTGKDITLKPGSVIDASGTNGGGTVLIGGNAKGKGPEPNAKTVTVQSDAEILASAKLKGDGGQVVVWADDKTQFNGKIEAKGGEQGGDGGFVETSAKLLIIGDPAVVNTSAQKGDIGEWLLDPNDFVISKTGGDITGKNLSENLKLTSITIDSSQGSFEGNGDIFVNDEISWSSDSQLSLLALNSIYILNDISASGDNAKLVLRPIQSLYITNSKINLIGSSQKLIISGKEYTIINDITDLQNIENDLYYNHPRLYLALGNDIDASLTLSWNDGKGFTPLGNKFNFTGHFNGLGHTISNIYINRPDEDNVGVFKILGDEQNETAHISNLNLKNINVMGKNYVGSIAGKLGDDNISGSISNVAISGKIQGINYVGGLAGYNDFRIINVHIRSSDDGEATVVKGLDRVGGITGHNIYTIEKSDVRDTIVDGSNIVGGLTGFNSGEISQSFVNASVRGYEYIGGFVGIIDSSEFNGSTLVPTHNAKITNSYVVGKVVFDTTGLAGNLNPFGGGFAGGVLRDALIENSYAAVAIEYDNKNGGKLGGFIGEAYGPITVKNSYWDKELCGVDIAVINSLAGVNGYPDYSNLSGLSTAEMREKKSFPNWDFNNIWILDEKSKYPELRFPHNRVSVPTKPIETDKPDTPPNPSVPEDKPETNQPDTPDNPVVPDKPEKPSNPSTPEDKPDTSQPVSPNNPVIPDKPDGTGDNSGEASPQPPTRPDRPTNSGNSDNSGDSNQAIIMPVNPSILENTNWLDREYQDNKHVDSTKSEENILSLTDDYFSKILSPNGSGTAFNKLLGTYKDINNRFLIVTLFEEGIPSLANLVATNNWVGLLKDMMTNPTLWTKGLNVFLGNILLDNSSKCYDQALKIMNRPGERSREELIEVAKKMRAANVLGCAGMSISQNIYDEMKERSDYINEHPVWGTIQNIGSLAGDTATGLVDSFVDIGLGINKNVTKASDFIAFGNFGKLMDLAELGENVSDLSYILNSLEGGKRMLGMISASERNEYSKLVEPKVKLYNKIIKGLEYIP